MAAASDQALLLEYLCEEEKSVIDWCKSNNAFPRSSIFEERLAASSKLVDEGNILFKAGNSTEAKLHYLAAGYHADFDQGQQWDMTADHKQQIRSAKIRALLNIANCGNKLGQFSLTKKSCTLGLKLCSQDTSTDACKDAYAKFFYRRAKAMLETGCLKEAVSDAKLSLEILPNDTALREVYAKASQGMKKLNAEMWKDKNLFDFPQVDLTLTDKHGKPIAVSHSSQRNNDEPRSSTFTYGSIWDFFCCKRKRKIA